MAIRSIYESDLSGNVVKEGSVVTLTVDLPTGRSIVSHISSAELDNLVETNPEFGSLVING